MPQHAHVEDARKEKINMQMQMHATSMQMRKTTDTRHNTNTYLTACMTMILTD